MSNRREFVAAGTGSAVLAGLGVTPALACPTSARRVGGSPALSAFKALEGQDFQFRSASGRRSTLRLVTVREVPSSRPLEQFSLVLRGPRQSALAGALYRLDHAQTGSFQLRLDASGQDELGPLYHADFSLLV